MASGSLRKSASVVLFSRTLTTLIDLGTGVALLRLLPKADYAVLAFVLTVYQTAQYVSMLGFPDSVFYFFERIPEGSQRRFAFQTSGVLVVSGIVAALAIWGAGFVVPVFLASWAPEQVAITQRYLAFVAVVALLEIPTWAVNNLMLASGRARDAAWYQVVTSVMTFGALVAPLLMGYGAGAVVMGLLLYAAARLVLSAAWMLRAFPSDTAPLPAGLWREQVRFALPLGINGLASRLNKQQDKYIVANLLPSERLAEYDAGARELPLLTVVPNALGSVLISRFVRYQMDAKRDELLALWYRSIEKTTLLVVPISVLFIAAARDFVPLLAGPAYTAAIVPFQLFTLVLLHRVTSYGTMLQAFGDTRSILRITIVLLVVNVVVSIPLTMWLGIVGAALGTVLANAVSWYLALHRIGRHLEVPTRRVLPFPFYLRTLATATVCGVAVYALRSLVETSYGVGFLGTFAVFCVLFAVLGSATRLITGEDWKTVGAMLRLK